MTAAAAGVEALVAAVAAEAALVAADSITSAVTVTAVTEGAVTGRPVTDAMMPPTALSCAAPDAGADPLTAGQSSDPAPTN